MSGEGVRVETQIEIGRPAQQVFDYVSTPALWHTWHPATVEIRDVQNRPLTTGETMLELIAVAGHGDHALWTVLACAPPQHWEIATDTAKGVAHIVYRITPDLTGWSYRQILCMTSCSSGDLLSEFFVVRAWWCMHTVNEFHAGDELAQAFESAQPLPARLRAHAKLIDQCDQRCA